MSIDTIRQWLMAQDPDDVVAYLRIETEELIDAFPDKLIEFRDRGEVDLGDDDLS